LDQIRCDANEFLKVVQQELSYLNGRGLAIAFYVDKAITGLSMPPALWHFFSEDSAYGRYKTVEKSATLENDLRVTRLHYLRDRLFAILRGFRRHRVEAEVSIEIARAHRERLKLGGELPAQEMQWSRAVSPAELVRLLERSRPTVMRL